MIRLTRAPVPGSSAFHLGRVVGIGRLQILRNGAGVARQEAPWRLLAQLVLVVPGVVLFVLALSLGFAISLGQAGSLASARSLLSMLLLAGLVACFSGVLSTTLQSLYLGPDVRYLLTLPLPLRTLFLTKTPDLAVGAIPGVLFLGAITAGQLLGRAATIAYIPFAVATTAALIVIATSMSSIVTALVVRATPAKATRLALLLVSTVTVLGVGLLWQRLAVSTKEAGTLERAGFLGGAGKVLDYTPVGWASTVLAEATAERYAVAASWLGLLTGSSLLFLAAASALFAVTFARTLDLVENSGGTAVAHRAPAWGRLLLRIVPTSILPWVKREWLLMVRDLRRLSAAAWPISTLGAYLIAAIVRDSHADRAGDERFWLTFGAVALLPWAMSVGSIMFATGAEGREIALVRAMPVRARTLVAGKLFAYLVPIAAISIAAMLLIVVPLEGFSDDLVALVALTIWVAVGACAIDLGASSIAPNFEVEHIQRSTGILGRMIGTMAGGLFLALTLAALAFLPGTDGAVARTIGDGQIESNLPSGLVFLTLAAAVPGFMLVVAHDRYRRLLGQR